MDLIELAASNQSVGRDIETREDCEALVRLFYGRCMVDPVIGYLFTDVAHLDLEKHIPRMVQFWETLLLGVWTFHGGAFKAHLELHKRAPLRHGHFERWLYLWRMSVDDLFIGERADKAKHHAERIAAAFESRLRSLESRDEGSSPAGALVIEHVG